MLAASNSRVRPEPLAADRTRSLPGLWHGDASWSPRVGTDGRRLRSECLDQFWKAGDGNFSQAPKDIEGELQTRKAWGHPVELLTLRPAEALSTCHLLFIPVTEKNQAGKIVRSLEGSSTLTVGETEGFAAMGGVINLTVEKSEIRFEVNPLAAGRAHLKISSKLLSLARIVTDQGQAK
jgi:hypothetical protein